MGQLKQRKTLDSILIIKGFFIFKNYLFAFYSFVK